MKSKAIFVALVLTTGAATGFPALAANNANTQAEMQAVTNAKISLSKAISAAESQTGGKAIEATFTQYNGTDGYIVSLFASDGSEQDLFIDGNSGTITQLAMATDNGSDNEGAMGQDGDNEDNGNGNETEQGE